MRRLRSAWQLYYTAATWVYNTEDPPLLPGEQILMRALCSAVRGVPSSRGILFLTSSRLLYRPSKLRVYPFGGRRVEISLDDVKSVQRVGWFRAFRPGLPGVPKVRLEVATGQEYVFQTVAAGYISSKIREAAAAAET